MKTKLFIIVLLILSLRSLSQTQAEVAAANEAEAAMRQVKVKHLNLSLMNLIASSDKYDGEMVQVKGYLHLEANSNAIYFHEADYKNKITANGFAVTFDDTFVKKKNILDYSDKYVIIIGRFSADDKGGKSAQFSGSIKSIIRLDELK